MSRKLIENIVDEYNYSGVIFYISEAINLDDFYNDVLLPANIGHVYRYESIRDNRLFYIENCDLQDIPVQHDFNWDISDALEAGFSILQIVKSDGKYYVKCPI